MTTGQATDRAHAVYAHIDRRVLEAPVAWRTPREYTNIVNQEPAFPRWPWDLVNEAKVALRLRALRAEGDVESRPNPSDARSTQFRVCT